jgi:hypothetical protein
MINSLERESKKGWILKWLEKSIKRKGTTSNRLANYLNNIL